VVLFSAQAHKWVQGTNEIGLGRVGSSMSPLDDLEPFEDGILNVVIETPKGSRNKFKYDEKKGLFKLSGVLPCGASFPFDFGFVPGTLAEDGDPLDVLVLMDEPAFAGCLISARAIGAIKAKQEEDHGMDQNDRLIAIAENSRLHKSVRELDDLSDELIHEIEHFFVSYNQAKGKEFRLDGRLDSHEALELVRQAIH
jgi:inorganic pyrophosphatase